MILASQRRRIHNAANQMLRLADVTSAPVPVEQIAILRGAHLKYAPYDGDMSGLLYRDADSTVIGINSLHHVHRQRFTIAHELGHLALHAEEELHVDRNYKIFRRETTDREDPDPKEIEANAFAAELLMPSALVTADFSEHALDYERDTLVEELAERYRVSLQAMIFRLTNLKLITGF